MEQVREPSREQSRGSSRGSSSRQSRTWSSARMTVSRSSRSTMSVVSDSEGAVLSDSGGRGGPPAARSMDTCALRSIVSSRKMVASFSAFLAFTCGGDGNQTSSDAIRHEQTSSDAIRHEQTSSDAIRRHQTSSHLGEHSEAGLGPPAVRVMLSLRLRAALAQLLKCLGLRFERARRHGKLGLVRRELVLRALRRANQVRQR
jgi:hypothetical protein